MINLPKSFMEDAVETPAGLLVPSRSAESLIKAEAKKMRVEENKAAFFSKFALAQNMVAYGAREKPAGTPSFAILYESAKRSFVDAILIRARIDQQKRIWQKANDGKNKDIGFRVVHERQDDPDYKVTKNDKERCAEMEKLLGNPTPAEFIYLYPHNVRPHTNLKDLVSVLTRAELIIDRKCILRYKRRDGQGYAAFHWLPGESIKNVDESVRAWAQKNEKDGKITKDTIDKMSLATGFDIANAAYVQMIDGMITAAFTDDEISVHISNPSDQMNRFGYGESRLELSLDITTTLLMAWTYNREMFKTNYPEQVLTVAGDYDKEGLQAFKQQLLAEAGGVGNNWRLPVIPAGDIDNFKIESVKLRESPKDMLFDQMIRLAIMLKAAAYGAHPSTLNLEMDSGNGGGNLFGANPASEIEFSKEHGLIPSLTDMCEWFTDCIIHPRYDDLKLILVGLNPEDEKAAVDIRTARVSKWDTRNEARSEEGKSPIGFWLPPEQYNKLQEGDPQKELYDKNPWNYPADVAIPNYINTFSMAGQQGQDQGDDGQYDDQQDQGDDQQDQDQQDDGSDQYYKALRKSRRGARRKTKFLQISLDDQL
ncbi:phage portal protein [Oryzomonas rubra]|uniref:Phage portal protein n=1 Tax=Oryzomonas rubra TaxID=2509454 RepID=A0A5A9X8E1_9BACT|nr:phage portal protein [Oryzomonas rubra]KAA0888738.1 phage portal protein [Oryzomonas rubra]